MKNGGIFLSLSELCLSVAPRWLVSLLLGLSMPVAGLAALADEDLQRRYQAADMVSLVKVKYIGDLVNPAMSVHGLIAVEGYVYTAQLLQQWKGAEQRNFKIRVNLNDCHARLQLDSEYVVFGKQAKDYDFQSFSCDDLVPREQALALVEALNNVRDRQVAEHPKAGPAPI
ncbi:hypothetical protein [Exilibacterium tricleocarpae]|uniref:hypothetical protein n=1 Tax=Exilibacterium tricleocarpae TaxID=2591008 RepID=UPI0015D10F30|nr:hypothetical protein [Exilibacterium tricleocarpae]